VIANPSEGVDIIVATEPLSNAELELKRLEFALNNLIFSDESKANGIGAIDPERLARSIDVIRDLYDLPATPAASAVFNDAFLPGKEMRSF
jgi:NitT/TauT family transport system substrate-binding protein